MIRIGWINSLLGSFLVSLCCPCCFLPLVLNLFGIGCAGLTNFLLPYRPVFMSLTVISLTYSYVRYRPSKWNFLAIVLITLILSFSSDMLRAYENQKSASVELAATNAIITHWQIIGMHCESCRLAASRAISNVKDVLSVNVDLDSGQADVVTRIPIDDDFVISAVQNIGFQIYKIV